MMRKPLVAGMATALTLGIAASPAAAKKQYTYTAVIDCGSGPVEVLSTDDLFAPLFDPATGRKYQPLAWSVVFDGQTIEAARKAKLPKHAVECSYDDGMAAGTVTVKKA